MATSDAEKPTQDWVVRIPSSGEHSSSTTSPPWEAPPPPPPVTSTSSPTSPQSSPTSTSSSSSWHSLFSFTTRTHLPPLLSSLLGSLLAGVLKPASSIFFGKIFSILTRYGSGDLSAHSMLRAISWWCIALTVLGVSAWLAEGIFLSAWIIFGEIQAKTVRETMFAAMLEKDQEWYDLREDGIGSLLIRIQTQVRELQLAVSQPLGLLLFETVAACTSLGIALFFSWKLTLVMLATFPVVGIMLVLVSRGLAPAVEAEKRELTRASRFANTAIAAIDTVKACNGQNQEMWQYRGAVTAVSRRYLLQARSNALQFGITKFLIIALFVQGFWFGIYLVNHGLDPGHVLTTFYACLSAMQATEVIIPQWLVLVKGISAGETLKSIMRQMEHDRKREDAGDLIKPESCHGDVEINNISFAYPSNIQYPVLRNVSLFFPAGETTFVVGTSGSGKSTIGNLLMRYYAPLSGSIHIDGHPIQTLDTDWLRHNITLVQQDSVLFSESIRQNIAFGNRDLCRPEAIARACETACLTETLDEMPEGLDTVVGLGGRALSGGQQQRVAIARARLRDAPILILDESTSALDHTSRIKVMQAMREWRRGKTTIIITHDMSQILDDDYVYVLSHGKLVQEGYRRKLAAKTSGAFASLLYHPEEKELDPEPPPPMQVFEEEDFSHRWRYISNVFGSPPPGRRPSGSDLIWGSPVATNSRRLSSILQPDLSFISPRSSSAPSRVEQVIDHAARGPTWNTIDYKRESCKREGYKRESSSSRRRSHTTDTTAVSPVHQPPSRPARAPVRAVPSPDTQRPASLTRIFGSIWPTLSRRNRIVFVSGFAAALVVAIGTPAFAYIFSRLLNVFYLPEAQRAGQALRWALWLLAVAIVDGTASFGTHYALESSAQAWITALRLQALERILAQPKAWFEEEANTPGRLSECLDRNAEEMRNLVGRFTGLVFTVFWMLGISLAVSFAISWRLTLVALGCGPIVYAIMRVFHIVSSRWEERCNDSAEAAGQIFTETFSHIRVVRALTLENYFARKHRQATVDAYQTGLRRAAFSGSLFGLSDGVTFFIMAAIFYYGTVLISSGSHSVGSILQVINLLLFGLSNGSSMMSMVPQISSSRATATSMLRLANLPVHASHESFGTTRLPSPLPIQMTDLSFTHSAPPYARTLSGVSLRFTAGTCTAIVGPSGSGKSTLLSVLQCLYPPDAAEPGAPSPLTFAGVPANQCSVAGLREHIAIVPQTPVLFPATILANIVYGLPETSPMNNPEAAQRAAEQAGIHDFIASLDEGYGTRIGDGGMGLSGGQAQRVAIARALVRRPRVLVLDEGTSGLDGEGAEGVRRVVRGMVESGVTAVVVSHGVEMMKSADRIVVVEEGRVVEEGGFEELCDRGGALARLIGVEERGRTR